MSDDQFDELSDEARGPFERQAVEGNMLERMQIIRENGRRMIWKYHYKKTSDDGFTRNLAQNVAHTKVTLDSFRKKRLIGCLVFALFFLGLLGADSLSSFLVSLLIVLVIALATWYFHTSIKWYDELYQKMKSDILNDDETREMFHDQIDAATTRESSTGTASSNSSKSHIAAVGAAVAGAAAGAAVVNAKYDAKKEAREKWLRQHKIDQLNHKARVLSIERSGVKDARRAQQIDANLRQIEIDILALK